MRPASASRISTLVLSLLSLCAVPLALAADPPAGSAPDPAMTAGGANGADASATPGSSAMPTGGNTVWTRVTPLSKIWTGATDPDDTFSGAYTRLIILSRHTRPLNTSAGDASYCDGGTVASGSPQIDFIPYQDRGWLARALNSRHYAVNLTATLKLGDYEATIPLATLDHESSASNGESYVRLVNHSAQAQPLVLLKADGSNAIASVRFTVRASDQFTGATSALAVQAATALVSAVAPEAGVLTSLSSQRSKDAAKGLDSALGSLLQKSLVEDQVYENDLRRWGQGVFIDFYIPKSEGEFPKSDNDLQPVGRWKVGFELPRPSIFSDVQICRSDTARRASVLYGCKATAPDAGSGGASHADWCEPTLEKAARRAQVEAGQRPAHVLQFNVAAGQKDIGTVHAYLKSQDWWTAINQDLAASAKGSPAELKAPVENFCRSIKEAVAHLQLNEVDGGIITQAVAKGITLPPGVSELMQHDPACALRY